MDIRPDAWLAELFGHAVFALHVAEGDAEPGAALAAHAAAQARAFYFAKLDTRRVAQARQLAGAGMYVVDVNVVFSLDRPPVHAPGPIAGVEVGEPAAHDSEAVLDVAENAFEVSRFHLDPRVSKELAGRIKRAWVASYLRKLRGDRLFVARREGRAVGFLAALWAEPAQETAVIDLIGVAPDQHRRRIGEALVNAFVAHYRPAARALIVGTQVANIRSMRFYEKLGFSMSRSQYVLHGHVRDGRAE